MMSKQYECCDCVWYNDYDIPKTTGCGECRRFPPTAIRKCDQPYAMGHYPVIPECNPICGEFYLDSERRKRNQHAFDVAYKKQQNDYQNV